LLMLLALVAGVNPVDGDQRLSRMTALFERVCLRTFPDDKAVEAVMNAIGAPELGQDEVKVTMRDDPARAWNLPDGATLWIEFPPYHACSVRWSAARIGDLKAYRTVADKYEGAVGGFSPIDPYNDDQGDIHIHAVGEQRTLLNNSSEALFVFDQKVRDRKRREAGETGVNLRFVHQFAPAPSGGK
jgi:hypothetical protein